MVYCIGINDLVGNAHVWQYLCGGSPGSGANTKFCNFGPYTLTIQAWHEISTTLNFVDPSEAYFYDVQVDGKSISDPSLSSYFDTSIIGKLAPAAGVGNNSNPSHAWPAYRFSWFPGGNNYNQSIYSLGNDYGYYTYLDDVTIDYSPQASSSTTTIQISEANSYLP